MTTYSLIQTIGPASEPVSLAEARDQCEIGASVTAHDTKLNRYMVSAREQVENDTGYALITQTLTLSFTAFPSGSFFDIPIRPIQSISITYYDASNAQQTLDTAVYQLDKGRRRVYLKHNQSWPAITEQHNGIVVTIVAGYGTEANVPRLFKQACLLQVAKWWAHRGDESKMIAHDTAYERIIRRFAVSYP